MDVETPEQLKQAAEIVKKDGAHQLTVRELLGWYGYARRGSSIISVIRKDLERLKLATAPNFEGVWIDRPISLIPRPRGEPKQPATPEAGTKSSEPHDVAPSHRISRLEAASREPVAVKPSDNVQRAVTLMMTHDYSQLPVMTSPGTIKGMVSWRSIGHLLTMGSKCEKVDDCIEPHHEVRDSASMFDVIRLVTRHDCVVVRDENNRIVGIVTAADISGQFRKLSEPFLLLGDIESNLRRLIENRFIRDELSMFCDPEDGQRKIESAAEMTFGEYMRLLENSDNWTRLNLSLDRVVFREKLDEVRRIRNDVMHFDPDGIAETQLDELRRFSRFLERIVDIAVQ